MFISVYIVMQAAVTREYSEDIIRNVSDKFREVSSRNRST